MLVVIMIPTMQETKLNNISDTNIIEFQLSIPNECAGQRLDKTLAELCTSHSRERLSHWVEEGFVLVDGKKWRPKDKVKGLEEVTVKAHLPIVHQDLEQPIPLDIIYEDEALLVINKPAGLVVHPAAGNPDSTLLNALLYLNPACRHLPRAGIIHRLDKDTTGLMVVAKTLEAYTGLINLLQNREIERIYTALVLGALVSGGVVAAPIGRHPRQRLQMAVVEGGKEACTHYRILKKYQKFTLLKVMLESGRTHQIRVHMAHIRHPLIGDALYGWRYQAPKGASDALQMLLLNFRRQALHATELRFNHPLNGQPMHFIAPIPKDMQTLLDHMI